MSPKVKVYGSAIALFLAGAVSGGFGSTLAGHCFPHRGQMREMGEHFGGQRGPDHQKAMTDRMHRRLSEKLQLSTEQQEQLRKILNESGAEFKGMHDRHQGERKELMRSSGDKIRGILTSEQAQRFDKMREKMRERMERRGRGDGPGDRHDFRHRGEHRKGRGDGHRPNGPEGEGAGKPPPPPPGEPL